MNFEEKTIRYIAEKLIQKRLLALKGEIAPDSVIVGFMNRVLNELKNKYKKLDYVRIKSRDGIVTPQIMEAIDKILPLKKRG